MNDSMGGEVLRFTLFMCILIGIALWEVLKPRRELKFSRRQRWFHNLTLAVFLTLLNSYIFKELFNINMLNVTEIARDHLKYGLLNKVNLAFWIEAIISFLVLDLGMYLYHMLAHYIPALWILHKVHHSDIDFDFTTATRFHPLEFCMSLLFMNVLAFEMGAIPAVAITFDIMFTLTSLFNHGNIKVPVFLDRYLRLILVTPDYHRIHHSVFKYEFNSNFGINLSFWDYLFGKYIPQPSKGHVDMDLGIRHLSDPKYQTFFGMLYVPFSRTKHDIPGNVNRKIKGCKS